jgi:pyruvate,water dikinase
VVPRRTQYWIVQSRPVTTRRELRTENSELRTATFEPEWTRANLAEVLPDQLSPQAMSLYVDLLNKGERQFMGRLFASDDELGPILKVFHGRLYFNLSQLRRVCAMAGAPAADLLKSFGHPEEIRPEDHVPAKVPLMDRVRALPDFISSGIKDLRAESILREHEARSAASIARLTSVDPATLSDREICDMFQWWVSIVPDSIQVVFVMGAMLLREQFIRAACDKVGFPYDRLVYPQLAAGERSVSTQQAIDLVALSDVARQDPAAKAYLLINDGSFIDFRTALAGTMFLDRLERFLEKYGHRGRYESDWALPRLRENPAPLLFAIREQMQGKPQDQKAIAERQEADAAAAWRAFIAKLNLWQRLTLLPRVRAALRRLKKQYVWREKVRSDLTRVLSYVRPYLLVLAARFVERGWIESRDDFFAIQASEVTAAIDDPSQGPGLRDIVRRRKAELAAERDLRLPLLMRESELPALMARLSPSASAANGNELAGLCVSPGTVEAEVVVMRDPSEFAAMKRGAILVAPATDPSWTPLFTLASGVIVEVGGMLSHASTIAREYGLPALANVRNATSALKTGDRVKLDASGGIVRRL